MKDYGKIYELLEELKKSCERDVVNGRHKKLGTSYYRNANLFFKNIMLDVIINTVNDPYTDDDNIPNFINYIINNCEPRDNVTKYSINCEYG